MSADAQSGAWSSGTAWRRLLVSCGLLSAALAVGFVVSVAIGVSMVGGWAWAAALVALAAVGLPSLVALVLLGCFSEAQQSASVVLGGILIRMAPPLLVGVVLLQTKHWLLGVGVLPMIVGMYLLALVVETLLSLWLIGAFSQRAFSDSIVKRVS
ncbi:MAG: hypothetical protein AB7O38_03830 [Pirellulaceae bacterium]